MNKVDLVVLGFLRREPMHGYQIGEFFQKRGIDFWIKIKMPSVYKALNRLEAKGYITGEVEVDENNRARKVYSITEEGCSYFFEMLNEIFFTDQFVSPADFWNAFRFLQGNVSKDYFIKIVKHRLSSIKKHREKMHQKRKCIEDKMTYKELPFYLVRLMQFMHKMGSEEEELLSLLLEEAKKEENKSAFENLKER